MRYIMISALFLLYAIKSYTCTFTLSLYDSFGDGWNGSTLTVQVNGVNVLTNITLSTGLGPATFTFTANDGDIITTIFYGSGLWESECNYTIINNLGLPNFADGMNNTVPTGGTFAADCGPPPPPPTYDDPCTAQPLTVGATCNYIAYTTQWATGSPVPNPSCSWSYMGGDVWFSAIVPASGRLTVDIAALGMLEGELAIYFGPNCNTLTELHCVATSWIDPIPEIFVYTSDGLAGQTVWIRIWEPNNDNPGIFNICAYETPPPPANDDPCTAQPLTVNATCTYSTYTTYQATPSAVANPSCSWSYMGGDVWFTAVVPASGRLTVDIAALAMTEGEIAVYYGPDCSNLTELHCITSAWNNPMPSIEIQTIDGLAGQTVWIRVWEVNNDNPGDFNICAFETPPPPANTDPCNAINLTVGPSCVFTTYSNQYGELSSVPLPSCEWNVLLGDLWFTATVPNSGRLQVQTGPIDVTQGGMAIYN
ncbi:MAG: hypothetical protein HY738_09450 [Bacteroidia bacterium]|nr:hypothetical protein [Bacteroidia bacterium]